MINEIRIYLALIGINYKFLARFKIGPLVFFIGNLISLVSVAYLWKAVFLHGGVTSGISYQEIVSYTIAARIVSMIMFSSLDSRLANDIKKGDYLISLMKPWDMTSYYLALSAGQTLLHLLWMGLPLTLLGLLSGIIIWKAGWLIGLLSLFLLFLGYLDIQMIKLFVGFSVVFTAGNRAIRAFVTILIQVGGGMWFPLALLPRSIQFVVYGLPFSAMGSISLHLLNGLPLPLNIPTLVLIQFAWTLLIFLLLKRFIPFFIARAGNVAN